MKVFLAGATGALGKRLVPQLIERGHEVVGTTRTESKAALLRDMGANAAP
jgi:2-alkyl-3-oxoalkanoate reductase